MQVRLSKAGPERQLFNLNSLFSHKDKPPKGCGYQYLQVLNLITDWEQATRNNMNHYGQSIYSQSNPTSIRYTNISNQTDHIGARIARTPGPS